MWNVYLGVLARRHNQVNFGKYEHNDGYAINRNRRFVFAAPIQGTEEVTMFLVSDTASCMDQTAKF